MKSIAKWARANGWRGRYSHTHIRSSHDWSNLCSAGSFHSHLIGSSCTWSTCRFSYISKPNAAWSFHIDLGASQSQDLCILGSCNSPVKNCGTDEQCAPLSGLLIPWGPPVLPASNSHVPNSVAGNTSSQTFHRRQRFCRAHRIPGSR